MTVRDGRVLPILLLLAAFCAPPHSAFAREETKQQIRFGAEMAQKGNWREAIFRWKRALEHDASNPRLHNNLAVAYETLGEYLQAEEEYKAALRLDPHVREIRQS